MLGLPASSEEKQVRIQVRKLARKVHPDKCSLFGAEAAFKAVCKAAAQATDAAGGESPYALETSILHVVGFCFGPYVQAHRAPVRKVQGI